MCVKIYMTSLEVQSHSVNSSQWEAWLLSETRSAAEVRMWREGTPTPIWAPTMEVSVELVGERKLELSLDPAIPPLGRCQQRGSGLDRKSD